MKKLNPFIQINKRTRELNKIFKYKKIKLQTVEQSSCDGCFFNQFVYGCKSPKKVGHCAETLRSDKKSVIFQQLTEPPNG